VHKTQQVTIHIADVVRHRFAAPAQQNAAIRIAKKQQWASPRIHGIARLQLGGHHIDCPKRTLGTVSGRVVAPVHVGDPPGETSPPEFIVLEAIQVGVQPPRCCALTQVDK
jgi:hypothetical protein